MARSYLPSKVSEIVALWRKDLNKVMVLTVFEYLCSSFGVQINNGCISDFEG